MFTTRRKLLQGAGVSSLLGLLPSSSFAAARKSRRNVYEELGIRPVINFRGTMTTLGASRQAPELFEAQAEAAGQFIVLEELKDAIGERLATLIGSEAALVSTGTAGAMAIGTYACVAGSDRDKIRRLPDVTGMKSEVVIQKIHRNGYDHAVRSAGVKIVEVEGLEELKNALNSNTAMIYHLGGTTGDWEWEGHVELEDVLPAAKKAGVPVMVDAANMLPPWENIRKLAALGTDLICISGGKHIQGPQCSGILAGRKDLIDAAWMNSSPHSDSMGRPMKVGREEMVALWQAVEKYATLDFKAMDKDCLRRANWLKDQLSKIPGLRFSFTPIERTRVVRRLIVEWDEGNLGITTKQVEEQLMEGEPRIAVARNRGQGIQFCVFMNEPGEEKFAARRMKEIFQGARRA